MTVIREMVRRTIRESLTSLDGAGIIILKSIGGTYHVLCLETHDGSLDFPKGHIETGEDPFNCAIRETREETGIRALWFPLGSKCHVLNDRLMLFCAITSEVGEVQRNPQTGINEHKRVVWMPIPTKSSILRRDLVWYLRPSVKWIEEIVEDKTFCDLLRTRKS